VPLFGRGRKSEPEVPEWAAPLGPAEFALFRDQLHHALMPYGGYELGDGFVTVSGRTPQYGLTNLLQEWSLVEHPERAGLIEVHFRNLFHAEDSEPLAAEELFALIRPRLWSSETVNSVAFPLITRGVADDLDAMLCVDLPTSVINLKPEQADAMGRSIDELWEIAIGQIDDGLPVGREAVGSGLEAFFGDSFFVASRLLDLDRFAGPLPPAGALVAVPHRHALIVHPIQTLEVVPALNQLIQVADGMHRQGPGSIVPHVYWWQREQPLVRIPATVDESSVSVAPPDEFVQLLNRLPGDRTAP
jgi:hypothetical protein